MFRLAFYIYQISDKGVIFPSLKHSGLIYRKVPLNLSEIFMSSLYLERLKSAITNLPSFWNTFLFWKYKKSLVQMANVSKTFNSSKEVFSKVVNLFIMNKKFPNLFQYLFMKYSGFKSPCTMSFECRYSKPLSISLEYFIMSGLVNLELVGDFLSIKFFKSLF